MNTHYYCRHCECQIGSIKQEEAQSLIMGQLTEKERLEMLHFDEDGNVYIKAICEPCQQVLENNPHYHEYEMFLQ